MSLNSVDDPVFLQYKQDVDAGKIEGVEPGDYHNLTAILTETKGITHEQLLEKIEKIEFTDYLQDLDAGIVGGFRGIPVIMIPAEAGSYDDTLFLLPSKGRV